MGKNRFRLSDFSLKGKWKEEEANLDKDAMQSLSRALTSITACIDGPLKLIQNDVEKFTPVIAIKVWEHTAWWLFESRFLNSMLDLGLSYLDRMKKGEKDLAPLFAASISKLIADLIRVQAAVMMQYHFTPGFSPDDAKRQMENYPKMMQHHKEELGTHYRKIMKLYGIPESQEITDIYEKGWNFTEVAKDELIKKIMEELKKLEEEEK